MDLAPGSKPELRLQGTIRPSCDAVDPGVPVVFNRMTETEAWFLDSKRPSTHWEGTVEDGDGRPTLRIDAID